MGQTTSYHHDACADDGFGLVAYDAHAPVEAGEAIFDVPYRDVAEASWTHRVVQGLKIRLHRFSMLTQRAAQAHFTPMQAVRVAPGRWMNIILSALGFLLILYFSYHALAGNRGWFALMDLGARETALRAELSLVREERALLERRVDLLAGDRIDPDLLEERARATLGFAHPDDLIIYRDAR